MRLHGQILHNRRVLRKRPVRMHDAPFVADQAVHFSRIPVRQELLATRFVGDEVPQVYLDAPEQRPEGVQFAMRTLVAFDRVTLRPGETRESAMHVAPGSLEYWSVAENRWIRSGSRRISVGSSSRDLKLSAHTQ